MHTENKQTSRNLVDVGPISDPVSNAGSSALLYTGGRLFSLHERGQRSSTSVFLKDLDAELQRVKSVVAAWEKSGAQPSSSRLSSYLRYPSSNRTCRPAGHTDGLVGFLSDNATDEYWENDLHREGAAVTKALKAPCGLRLQGHGARALWSVATTPEAAEYKFTNNEFTLVATVLIHNPRAGDIPLLSVGLDAKGGKRLLGLAYTTHRHWMARYGHLSRLAPLKWEPRRRYHVALTLRDGQGFVYVDGKPLPGGGTRVDRSKDSSSSLHVTFGAHRGPTAYMETDLTVASVMLYNRPLSEDEIAALHKGMEAVEAQPAAGEEPAEAQPAAEASAATDGSGAGAGKPSEERRGVEGLATDVPGELTPAKVELRGAIARPRPTRESGATGVNEAETEDGESPSTAGRAAQPRSWGSATSWALSGDSSVQVCGGRALPLVLFGLSTLVALC
ncbi:trans-sialidase [Trypanosoma conorhini]|uniref:Trans-sialidase n=1 Tax=Trypanosoma conorhini TaxID=83891 RepID=A0A3R7KZG9_9TRYP|nr:trans-sialidase [Trypanosoma conorhini]RNF04500.1 trans-sialidase [Trypanosoma conorhini]